MIKESTAAGLNLFLAEFKSEGRRRISPHFQLSFCNAVRECTVNHCSVFTARYNNHDYSHVLPSRN